MMEEDAVRFCGPRHGRGDDRAGHRWGITKGKSGFHGGKIEIERPRVRTRGGDELVLPSWAAAVDEDLLGQWALNLMLMNVSTRKFGRAVRLPGDDIPAERGAGVTQIGGVTPVRGLVGREDAGVDGHRPLGSV